MSNKDDNVSVMQSPKWTPEQALLEVSRQLEDVDKVAIVFQRHNGSIDSVTANMGDAGNLLIASEILRMRATDCFVLKKGPGK